MEIFVSKGYGKVIKTIFKGQWLINYECQSNIIYLFSATKGTGFNKDWTKYRAK